MDPVVCNVVFVVLEIVVAVGDVDRRVLCVHGDEEVGGVGLCLELG